MSERYIFVHRIDKKQKLEHGIPLHMTALHWFDFDGEIALLSDLAKSELQEIKQIQTKATHNEMFGPEHDIPVVRLERTPELLELHLALLGLAKRLGAHLDERWVGAENWNPHVTNKPGKRLEIGDEVLVKDIDLIKRDPAGNKTLVNSHALKI